MSRMAPHALRAGNPGTYAAHNQKPVFRSCLLEGRS